MNWLAILQVIKEILTLIKDTDKDGRPDIFDGHPDDPERK